MKYKLGYDDALDVVGVHGFGGMVVFELEGGFEAAREFTARLRLARRAVSLGGTETLVVHAASMIHARLTAEQRAEAGISENLIRVSVGLEDAEDIIADFDQALRSSRISNSRMSSRM